jgi:hypothetical protein
MSYFAMEGNWRLKKVTGHFICCILGEENFTVAKQQITFFLDLMLCL